MKGKINKNKKDDNTGEVMGKDGEVKERESFSIFSNVVDILKDLTDRKEFKIGFPAHGITVFTKKEIFDKALKDSDLKIAPKKFNEITKDILEIIYVILTDRKTDYIKVKSKTDNLIVKKVELVASKLINKEINEKYLLNKIYKTNILEEFDWEIVKKYYDKNENEVDDFPITTLRFRIRHTLDDATGEEKISTFIFECTEHGIDELIQELKNIKKAFEKLKLKGVNNVQ